MKAAILGALAIGVALSTAAQAQKNPEDVNPTHFLCYRATQGTALKPLPKPVTLTDQFGTYQAKVGKPLFVCTPVIKNKEETKDMKTHLVCYQVTPRKVGKKAKVTNQFGSQIVSVLDSYVLCLPSDKEIPK
jgi:hypothetical protein